MTLRSAMARIGAQEDLNFLLTNRIPRTMLTRLMGRVSRIEQPLVRDASLALWRFFCDVDLTQSEQSRFASLHEAFIRKLKPGARVVDPDPAVLASPCDAIVGAHGRVSEGLALQVKGMPYRLDELVGDMADARAFADGWYVTLRLTAGMYHRFHAPHDLTVEQVRYISGDTWNVNPIALKRIERLFCRNERAPIRVRLEHGGARLMLVPVAAVLVASIRLPWLDAERSVREGGVGGRAVSARFAKGAEMGWFEHGSTIVVLAPRDFALAPGVCEGGTIRMGEPLMRLPD
ncbi:phosphatidylserine decarboxylase [Novosphingobium sp. PC22D]|uniref:archaetidylserine decarboxylase n=1 Tax=Novosphingobium sp. PC22D TaxID=1962403 RepID=UPI000BEF729C|nr:archaetidylserine decarboxylase [Novosphingobium sp. PC22D]PEQ12972.1 phosphatidylserine decarboxylase [Novosphingobium sp. PC22D]